jgi:hypothetical protein
MSLCRGEAHYAEMHGCWSHLGIVRDISRAKVVRLTLGRVLEDVLALWRRTTKLLAMLIHGARLNGGVL